MARICSEKFKTLVREHPDIFREPAIVKPEIGIGVVVHSISN